MKDFKRTTEELRSEISTQKTQIINLNANVERLENDLQVSKRALAASEVLEAETMSKHSTVVSEYEDRIKSQEAESVRDTETIENLKMAINDLKQETKKADEIYAENIAKAKADLQQQIAKQKADIVTSEAAIKKCTDDASDQKARLDGELEKLKQKTQELEKGA